MSEDAPATVDAARIAALAERLGVSPREVLAVAARVAFDEDKTIDAARLAAELARARSPEAQAAVELLLLGYPSFAQDDLDHALKVLWSGTGHVRS